MFKNYMKVAWRNLQRNKVYSAIKILGLATGIASCILIFLYVRDEMTYESHFTHANRIVRIVNEVNQQGQVDRFAVTPPLLGPPLATEFPEVELVTQVQPMPKQPLWINGTAFSEDHFLFADTAFFRIFDFPFVMGNPLTALQKPFSIVLSVELAEKFFGSPEAAMDKTLKFTHNRYTVAGVFRHPGHSHIRANAFLAAKTALTPQEQANGWIGLARFTYARLLRPGLENDLEAQLAAFVERTVTPWYEANNLQSSMAFHVQPLRDIHLDASFSYDLSPAGNRAYVYIFGSVAFFLLLIACINYINLATARSSRRAREVGMRKVVGAHTGQVLGQFLGESLLLAGLAMVVALVLVELLLPYFNFLANKNFTLNYFLHLPALGMLALVWLVVGLGAGSYPAFFLSRFEPIEVLKADKLPSGSNALLRKGLVVVQFTISLVLIIGTMVVFRQMRFLKNQPLGFDKEHLLVIDVPGGDSTLLQRLPTVQETLSRYSRIKHVSTTAHIPGKLTNRLLALVEGPDTTMQEKTLPILFVGYDFLEGMGIKLAAGRNFAHDRPADLKGAFLINETAARTYNWPNPIGKKILMSDWDGQVIGVVKDFHFTSLHHPLEPLFLVLAPKAPGYLLIRMQPEEVPATLKFIEEEWQAFDPKHPMERFFLDEDFNQQYQAEEKLLVVFGYFAGLTIFIACLGLFGLSSFTAEQRAREVGIRKAMGSTTGQIVLLLSRDFAYLVAVSVVLASPIAWFGMRRWLQDFAYQLPIPWCIFLFAGLLGLFIALLTVGVQAFRAALINPVKALRAP